MNARPCLLAAVLLCLAACGSSPKTQFFTLSVVPAATPAMPIAQPVTVAAVHVPDSLDRLEMVRRTGDNTVDVEGTDRWTASLDDMSRRILAQDLAERLPREKVILPDVPTPPHTASIVVSIAEFGTDPSGGSVLSGSWSLLKSGSTAPSLRRDFDLRGGTVMSAADQAAAMSDLLGQLASAIAASLPRAS